jgi:peptidoglycan/LPS O-acetylase OafA/YrhL
MIKRFEKAELLSESTLNVVLNYFVMRFFRIYASFVVFCFLATQTDYEFFINNSNPISFKSLILLEYSDFPNHSYLWTIPVEIKYYFLVPFIAYLANRLKLTYKQSFFVHLMVMLLQLLLMIFDFEQKYSKKSQFLVEIPVFLAGSSLANLYKSLIDAKVVTKINDNKILITVLSIICVVWFYIGSRLHVWFQWFTYHFCIFWSTHMLLMLISAPNNYFTSFLSKLSLLKTIGKYSFGFYLFHGVSMSLFKREFNWLRFNWLDNLYIKALILNGHALFFGYLFFNLVENNCISIANRINAYLYDILNREKSRNNI